MFAFKKDLDQPKLLKAAFEAFPTTMTMTPRQAYQQLTAGNVESVPLSELAGRTVATSVVPPPLAFQCALLVRQPLISLMQARCRWLCEPNVLAQIEFLYCERPS